MSDRLFVQLVLSDDEDDIPTELTAEAGGNILMDIQGLLRTGDDTIDPTVTDMTINADLIDAEGFVDLDLLEGLDQREFIDPDFSVTVTDPALTDQYENRYDQDTTGLDIPLGVFGGNDPSLDPVPIETTYDFGLIEAGGTDVDTDGGLGDIDIVGLFEDGENDGLPINVTAITNILETPTLGSGNIDVLTNGDIDLTEDLTESSDDTSDPADDDLRAGLIESTEGDVDLTAANASIIDAPDDGDSVTGDTAADVVGVNIRLTALSGGIGTSVNPLDIDTSNLPTGTLTAMASDDIFIIETIGALDVNVVESTSGNVTLVSTTGGIFDANNDALENVIGTSIDLSAPIGGIGLKPNPLEIDTGDTGTLTASAQDDIFITETAGDLNLDQVQSTSGIVRLVVDSGSILDGTDALNGSVEVANVQATSIDLVSNDLDSGSIGTSGDDLNTITGDGAADRLYVTAAQGIFITEMEGLLNVLQAITAVNPEEPQSGPVVITVLDAATGDQDLTLLTNGNDYSPAMTAHTGLIKTAGADVTLTAGDDVIIPSGTTIDTRSEGGGNITINVDPAANDPDSEGGLIEVKGRLLTLFLAGELNGGEDNDQFDVIPQDNPLEVNGDLPVIPLQPGEEPGDTLTVDLSGGTLTNTPPVGDGQYLFTGTDLAPITYTSIEGVPASTDDNDAPVNFVPSGPHTTAQDTLLLFPNFSDSEFDVLDSDAGDATDFQVEFSVVNGTLDVEPSATFSGVTIGGRDTATVTLTGTQSDISGLLSSFNGSGVEYMPNTSFTGVDTLTMVSDDNGNTGDGGAMTDTDSITIVVGDTTPPTVDLADPLDGDSISATDLNGRGFIDVTFSDVGSEVDVASISGDELRLSGEGVGTATLSGDPILQSGTTYRYEFTGDFTAGQVTVSVLVDTFADLAGNFNEAETTESFTVTGDLVDPPVSGVKISSTDWTSSFLAEIDPTDNEGYLIPTDSTQLDTLSWGNMDQVLVKFSEDVSSNFANLDASLNGVNVTDYTITSFTYDAGTQTATVLLDTDLSVDNLLLVVTDTTTSGQFTFRFNALPGDLTNDDSTSVSDIGPLRAALGLSIGAAGYDEFADLNGDGSVAVSDIGPMRDHLGLSLPAGEPVALTLSPLVAPVSASAAGGSLFSPTPASRVLRPLVAGQWRLSDLLTDD